MNRAARVHLIALLLLVAAGLTMRVVAASKTGLSVDEVFSLAMATGHSLEHPAAVADPGRGDYIESAGARPPAEIRRYAEHPTPSAGPGRVARAVFLSDTSPPLYYLAVSAWTRVAGTSDLALRLLSTLFFLAAVPLVRDVALRVGGTPSAWIALAIFCAAPSTIFYGAEGRMYALSFLVTLALVRLSLALDERGVRPGLAAAWVAVAAAGLLTHYFLAFIVLACAGWLVLRGGPLPRWVPLVLLGTALVIVAPWYVKIPESLAAWRVTAGWQDTPLKPKHVVTVPALHLWSYVSGWWGFGVSFRTDLPALALWGVLLALALRARGRELVAGPSALLWLCILGAIGGLLAFDLLRGSSASFVLRYLLAALPAAQIVVASWIGALGPRLRLVFVALVVVTYVPGWVALATTPTRPDHRFPDVARELDRFAGADGLVVVHSIPSGVVGVTRYMATDAPVLSWVPQLGVRDEADLDDATAGRCRVALAVAHTLGETIPAEAWLAARFDEARRERVGRRSRIVFFERGACDADP